VIGGSASIAAALLWFYLLPSPDDDIALSLSTDGRFVESRLRIEF
jgi:hypothetical protein